MTAALGADQRVELVADPGSLVTWDEDVVSFDPLEFEDTAPYRDRLATACERTGRTEAVLCGRVTVGGSPCAVVASEFGFLGGSIGWATGERIARAFDRARAERLPVVALPASGGTRMQEGSIALVQMAKVAAAVARLREAGLPYVVYLGDPTTGGVFASWASLGSVTFAMPQAFVGFVGPRVVEVLRGRSLPEGVQAAENLLEHGLVDALVAPEDLRERVERIIALTSDPAPPSRPRADAADEDWTPSGGDAWASLLHARDPERPGAGEVLARWTSGATVLRGDGTGRDDPACLTMLARLHGVAVAVIAQQRRRDRPAAMSAAGYRKARRAMDLAEQLGLPLVTMVDTPGAQVSVESEEAGLAGEIARCLARMSRLATPVLTVLLGEGGSGGALALLMGDRVVCSEHASLSTIAPEGASAILYRDGDHAQELARAQGISSWDLKRFGVVDRIVPEAPPAASDPEGFAARLGTTIQEELYALFAMDPVARLAARERRYRELGTVQAVG